MEKKIDLLKQDIAESLGILSYLVYTTSITDDEELLSFVKLLLNDLIDNLASDTMEVEE